MSKSQNIADTLKWKKRRKNHIGDKCNSSKCPICTPHKAVGGNSNKVKKAKQIAEDDKFNEEIQSI